MSFEKFYELLNKMPCLPLLMQTSSVFKENPLEHCDRKLSENLNIQLQVKISVNNEIKEKLSFYVRDELFSDRVNFLNA